MRFQGVEYSKDPEAKCLLEFYAVVVPGVAPNCSGSAIYPVLRS